MKKIIFLIMLSLVAKFTFAQTATPKLVDSIVNAGVANTKAQLAKLTYYTTNVNTVTSLVDASNTALITQLNALNYSVPLPPAPAISYSVSVIDTVGTSFPTLLPTNKGGTPVGYTITPQLSAGLIFNSLTGGISGVPTVAQAATVYTVIATNPGGSSQTTVSITIPAKAVTNPTNPTYKSSNPVSYSGLSNQRITGLSFDGGGKSIDLLVLNNCSNITIDGNRFSNTGGMAIRLYNCKNITVTNNFATMVNFFVHAQACTATKVNYNQGLNLWGPAIYQVNFAHWVQFNSCNGGGQQINYNRFESVLGVAVHPHDAISVDACNGIQGDSIQMNYNYIRGGQQVGYPSSGDTGGGIMIGDESGTYQVARGNVIVNPGCSGIQSNGSSSSINIEGNLIYNGIKNAVAGDGITILGTHSAVVIKNNRVWWLNKYGNAVANAQGETGYWFGGKATQAGVTMTNNNWLDKTLDPTKILPATLITMK